MSMQASAGHPLPEDLAAYADGEASREVGQHVESCPSCAEGAVGYARMRAELQRSLHRFDCPQAHTLGEYSLDLLDPAERIRVAAHAVDCDDCRAELAAVRGFLAQLEPLPRSAAKRVRRMVASLFKPAPGLAYGALRGSAESATRVFETEDVTVTLGPGQLQGSLIGLVIGDSVLPDGLADREVRLMAADGAVLSTVLDDLGNFEFRDLAGGPYALEVDLADGLLVIEELRVG